MQQADMSSRRAPNAPSPSPSPAAEAEAVAGMALMAFALRRALEGARIQVDRLLLGSGALEAASVEQLRQLRSGLWRLQDLAASALTGLEASAGGGK